MLKIMSCLFIAVLKTICFDLFCQKKDCNLEKKETKRNQNLTKLKMQIKIY